MSQKLFTLEEMLEIMGDSFKGGCQYMIDIGESVRKQVELEMRTKQKHMLSKFLDDMKMAASGVKQSELKDIMKTWIESKYGKNGQI